MDNNEERIINKNEISNKRKSFGSYVLVTPARNEGDYIEKTILSVVSQTILPKKWVIVSDGSTDSTDDIVKRYMSENEWIELIRMPERRDRHFAAKVSCFNAGYEMVKKLHYDIIGNLDADISFESDFFEYLLDKFKEMPNLGVAGTPFIEGPPFKEDKFEYNYNYVNIEHVSGQAQLFRRECFEDIGGYLPIKGGGVDLVAVTTARMMGWKTRTFTERKFVHHRKMGTGSSSLLKSRFRFGKQDYYLGSHPVWEIFRSFYQMKSKPYVLGGLFLFSGYFLAFLNRIQRPITQEFVKFRRKEQMKRLKKILFN